MSRKQHPSGRSVVSYSSMDDETRRRSLRKQGSAVYVRRMSSTSTTDRPFDRSMSQLSNYRKSQTSIRTRHTSVSRSEYHHDLRTDLSATAKMNCNLAFAAFVIVFGSSFQFGYNIGVLNQPNKIIRAFYEETYNDRQGSISESKLTILIALTTAIFIPSGFAGNFVGGYLADKIGRKRTILFSHIFAYIGSGLACACLAAKSPELLMLGRLFFGFNSGLGNCIAPMYLSEIAPVKMRGAFGTLHQLFITLGIMFSSIFGLREILGTEDRWPYLMLLEVIPATVSLIILPFLPESPRFLLLVKGDRDTAAKGMMFYRGSKDITTDMEEMDTENNVAAKSSDSENYTVIHLLKDSSLWRPLAVACMLQVIQQFSGINAIFFYSADIYKGAGIDEKHIQYAVVGTTAINVLMTVIAVPLMDIAGRRFLLLIPMAVMILDLVLIVVAINLTKTIPEMAYLSVVGVLLYVICFAVGLGPIPMMIGSELFRQTPRPSAMAAAGAINWLGTFVIAIAFPSVAELTGDYTFLIFLVFMICFIIFVYFFVPETKNLTFEEIAHQFSPGQPLEVEEMMDDVFGEEEEEEQPLPNEEGDHEEHQLVTLNFDKSADGAETKEDKKGNVWV